MHPPTGRRRGSGLPQCCFNAPDRRRSIDPQAPSYVGPAPANFTWDHRQLKEALRGRRVVLIGDSITRQWFLSLECYLTGAVEKHTWNRTQTAQKWQDLHLRSDSDSDSDTNDAGPNLGYANLYLKDVQAEIKVYFGGFEWPPPTWLLAMHAKSKEEKPDLVIIGQGAHFNDPNATGNVSLRANLMAYMESCQTLGLRCVLREPTPAHFWYPEMVVQSGLWKPARTRECISTTYNASEPFDYDTSAEWRNNEVHYVLNRTGQTENVMHIFDALLPLTYAHPGTDCTHWDFNMEYWEPWHAELFGLLERLPPRQEGSPPR